MKKICKSILAGLTVLIAGTFAFAEDFDWSQCWCTYGGGLKQGDIIVNVGAGINWDGDSNIDVSAKSWFVPAVEATLEVPVMIWKLPFSFGGSFAYDAYGRNYSDDRLNYSQHRITTGAMVKYHVHLPPKNLDLYAGQKVGFGTLLWPHTNGWDVFFYHSEMLGQPGIFQKDLEQTLNSATQLL